MDQAETEAADRLLTAGLFARNAREADPREVRADHRLDVDRQVAGADGAVAVPRGMEHGSVIAHVDLDRIAFMGSDGAGTVT